MRDHAPVIIEEFYGLWDRGDDETCPLDHFTECENVVFQPGAVKVRKPLAPYLTGATILGNALRIYNYSLQTGDSLLVLVEGGSIYHVVSPTIVYGPILTIAAMTDFGFQAVAGRAYITPYNSTANSYGIFDQKGLQNEFLYVYKGDGTAARKAAGPPPISASALVATPGVAGYSDLGFHIFAVVYETDTGYLTALGPLTATTNGTTKFAEATSVSETQGYTITNIPVSPDTYVTKRHIVATKAIPATVYNGDQDGYQFFFVPDGNIDDNVTTTKVVSFYDIDLLEDASHLIDNFHEIPAGVALTTYNTRLVLTTEYNNISLVRLSAPGEPEAFDQVDGLITIPLDGEPITNAQQFREVLYVYKRTRTYATIDNQDYPSTWVVTNIDNGIGCEVHGISQILDSGGVNTDYLAIASYSGLVLFNGTYMRPELSYKITSKWLTFDKDNYRKIQVTNDPINQIVYMTLPNGTILFGDYSEAISPREIKWGVFTFAVKITSIAFTNLHTLILATNNEAYP